MSGEAIGFAIINYIILYVVIRVAVGSATSEAVRMRHVQAQTALLMAIAHRHGVDAGELGAIAFRLNPPAAPGTAPPAAG